MVATSAGWNLPNLSGAILLLEAVNMHVGQVDRQLTMLRKAGHLTDLAAVALGQFTGFDPDSSVPIVNCFESIWISSGFPCLVDCPSAMGINQQASS